MVRGRSTKRTNTKSETPLRKRPCPPSPDTSDSHSSVSLSDSDFTFSHEDSTLHSNNATLVTLAESQVSEESTEEASDSSEDESLDPETTKTTSFNNEEYQQQVSVLKCRYRADLERIEDEGYGDYASGNVEMTRNRKYCKAVKLSERVFSLSSRSSRIRKEYEEECKKEVMRRDAQMAVGYGYMMPGADGQGLDGALGLQPRMDMECYPPTSQGVSYGFNVGGNLPPENSAFVQQFPPYLYTPQNPNHVFMNYDPRPQMPIQGPQMMGPSMRLDGSQQFLPHLENTGEAPSVAQNEYQLLMKQPSELKQDPTSGGNLKEDEDLNGGDNFNVDQYFNEIKSGGHPQRKTENEH